VAEVDHLPARPICHSQQMLCRCMIGDDDLSGHSPVCPGLYASTADVGSLFPYHNTSAAGWESP